MPGIRFCLTAVALLTLPVAASAQHTGYDPGGRASGHVVVGGGGHAAYVGRTYEITATSDGFVPASITVKRGELVRLVVTRKTDRTCAKALVIKDYGIDEPLPMDRPVSVEFTPMKSGPVGYACGMGMMTGVVVVD